MNRRGFLRSLIGAAAVAPAIRTWPFRTFFLPAEPRIVIPHGAIFYDNRLIWFANPEQKKAWDELAGRVLAGPRQYRVVAIDECERIVTLEDLGRGSASTWNNLQRSPIRWSSRNDPLRFA